MTNGPLGRLESVPLRECWKTEAADFTPWLAKEENITLLGNAIGIELEVEAQEKEVGPFRADILCKDTLSNNWVLIESQLEKTDHIHLGQLLTYAAGLNAVTIIWLADRFLDEHRAALDWLNDITDERFNFFGLEIELWKIGDSPLAPKFNVVCKPNDWTRFISKEANLIEGNLTEIKKLQLEFWKSFRNYLFDTESTVRPQQAAPQHWMYMAIGRSGFALCAIVSANNSINQSFGGGEIRAELALLDDNAKHYFSLLEKDKEQIEAEFGDKLYWYNPDDKKQSRIYVQKDAVIRDNNNWNTQHEWLKEKLEKLKEVFGPRIKKLNPEEFQEY